MAENSTATEQPVLHPHSWRAGGARALPFGDDAAVYAELLGTAAAWGIITDVTLVLAQFDHQVAWGRLTAGGTALEWPPDVQRKGVQSAYLLDLRLFSSAGELHLWRGEAAFHLRVLVDQPDAADPVTVDGNPSLATTNSGHCLDAYHYLWGNRIEDVQPDAPGWLRVREGGTDQSGGRGMRMTLPLPPGTDRESIGLDRLPLRLAVRSYVVTDDETSLADVDDYRLVALTTRCGNGWSGQQARVTATVEDAAAPAAAPATASPAPAAGTPDPAQVDSEAGVPPPADPVAIQAEAGAAGAGAGGTP